MILLPLLAVLALSQVSLAAFQPCPSDAACLYHAHCAESRYVLATTDQLKFDAWAKTNCKGQAYSTELFIAPISKEKFSISLVFSTMHVGLRIGKMLSIMADQPEASLSWNSSEIATIPYNQSKNMNVFDVELEGQNLFELFAGSFFAFQEGSSGTSSSISRQPEFWQRLRQIMPCEPALVSLQKCRKDADCVDVITEPRSLKCKDSGSMWFTTNDKSPMPIRNITCIASEWIAQMQSEGELREQSGELSVMCTKKKPSTCNSSLIIDNCPIDSNDCSMLIDNGSSFRCPTEEMWLISGDDKWVKLTNLYCDAWTGQWQLISTNGIWHPHSGREEEPLEIRCDISAQHVGEPITSTAVPTTAPNHGNALYYSFILPIVFYFVSL